MSRRTSDQTRRSLLNKTVAIGAGASIVGMSGCLGDDDDDDDTTGDDTDDDTTGDDTDDDTEQYPTQEINIVIATSEGGPTDILYRNMQDYLDDELGVASVPDYRPGGGGLIGLEHFWQQEPDGYTMCFNHTANTMLNAALGDAEYDPLEFEYIASTAETFLGWFSPTGRFEDWNDFVETIREEEVTTGTVGPEGSITHFELSMGLHELGVPEENINNVPYDGGGDVTQAVAAGDIDIGITDPVSPVPFAEEGDLEIMLMAAPEPIPTFPDAPLIVDLDEEMPYVGLSNAAMGPPGLDDDKVSYLEDAILTATANEDFQEWAEGEGYSIRGIGSDELEQEMQDIQSLADDYRDLVGEQ